MATSSFRSTTTRTMPTGKSSTSGDDESSSSNRTPSHRRYRSLSRFSHRMPDLEDEVTPVRRGKFVNTVRGSGFPEISLDDLAIDFFGSFSACSVVGSGDRGRSCSRKSGGGEEADMTVSQRRGRSVSRAGIGSKVGVRRLNADTESSRRRRSVSRQPSRGNGDNIVSMGKVDSGSANSRRRRSVSVARCRIIDSESDIDQFQSSSNEGIFKSSVGGNGNISGSRKPAASDHRPGLWRSFSQNEIKYLDGYSVVYNEEFFRNQMERLEPFFSCHREEGNDSSSGRHGMERIIRSVHSQTKGKHPIGDDISGGLYEAMRKELRNAVEDIKTELEQATTRTKKSLGDRTCGSRPKSSDAHHAISTISKGSATKSQQSEKCRQDLLSEILLEQQRSRELSQIVKELLVEKNNSEVSENTRAQKRSKDRNSMSKCLSDEAEKYIEEFISNIDETDFSSMDEERNETSSSYGLMKAESFQSPPVPKPVPVEMDGVMLPWLRWETSNDTSPLPGIKSQLTHLGESGSTQDASTGHDLSIQSPCKPGRSSVEILSSGPRRMKIEVADYLKRPSDVEFVQETWKQRHRISSGGMVLCSSRLLI